MVLSILNSFEAKKNFSRIKIFGFISGADRTAQERMKNILKSEIAAVHFKESNNMEFHYLSRNHDATLVCNLTSLFVLCPKFCP